MRRDSSFCAKSVRYNIFTNGAPYTSRKHTTGFILKRFGSVCGSSVDDRLLLDVKSLCSRWEVCVLVDRVKGEKFVSLSTELNHNRRTWMLVANTPLRIGQKVKNFLLCIQIQTESAWTSLYG